MCRSLTTASNGSVGDSASLGRKERSMTKLWWRSVSNQEDPEQENHMRYEDRTRIESKLIAGVHFIVERMSFGRRIELTRRIRELAERVEFLSAGESPKEKLDAALLTAEIERTYVLWGLSEVGGLELDGTPATPESLVSDGPEELFREALDAVK